MSATATPIKSDTCPKCFSWQISFVRFMTFNGNLSQEAEVSVYCCDQCGKKFVVSKKQA